MKVIVVDNPFVAMILQALLGDGVGGLGGGGTPFGIKNTAKVEAPDLKANPDFYTKPEVAKQLVLKFRSNTVHGKMYDVTVDRAGNLYCTCTGFKYRGTCSHVTKVRASGYRSKNTGLALCLMCRQFARDERAVEARNACDSVQTITCPPRVSCDHFRPRLFIADVPAKEKAELPMTFARMGSLLQTFQSLHAPEVRYEVKLNASGEMVCTCRGFNFHGNCKHVEYMKSRIKRNPIRI